MNRQTLRSQGEALRELDLLVRSRTPIIYVVTPEESRFRSAVRSHGLSRAKPRWSVVGWDTDNFLTEIVNGKDLTENSNRSSTDTVESLLDWFKCLPDDSAEERVLVVRDLHLWIGGASDSPVIGPVEMLLIHKIVNLSQTIRRQHKCLVMTGVRLYLPPELEKMVTVLEWPMPSEIEIGHLLDVVLAGADAIPNKPASVRTKWENDAEREEAVRACLGLTLEEVEQHANYTLLSSKHLDPKGLAARKEESVRKTGLVEWMPATDTLSDVGGMAELKKWLALRDGVFTAEAREFGLPEPKGLLICGVQGGGKSLIARVIAAWWKVPLLRLDMGRLFSGIVGSSEANLRKVIQTVEAVAPCVLTVDEFEKGLAGSRQSDTTSDGGVSSRILMSLLTWMDSKTTPVFVVATANTVSALPPEMLRKGRFDEIFFVDLPSPSERSDIFAIHLNKRNRDPKQFDLPTLVAHSDGYSGAEIEASVISGLLTAFSKARRDLTTRDIVEALQDTVPLSELMREEVQQIRDWAEGRTRNASVPGKGRKGVAVVKMDSRSHSALTAPSLPLTITSDVIADDDDAPL